MRLELFTLPFAFSTQLEMERANSLYARQVTSLRISSAINKPGHVVSSLRPAVLHNRVLQDVIEELIGTEIVDETDQFVDNLRSEKVLSTL